MTISEACSRLKLPVVFKEQPDEQKYNVTLLDIEKLDNIETFVFNLSEDTLERDGFNVTDINPQRQMFLLERTQNGTATNILLGKDTVCLFATGMDPRVETVEQSLQLLEPYIVRCAREKGKKVVRQGDWFFIPVSIPTDLGRIQKKLSLSGRHIAGEGIVYREKGVKRIYVRGDVSHHQHTTIQLPGWHRAIQNQTKKYKMSFVNMRVTKTID